MHNSSILSERGAKPSPTHTQPQFSNDHSMGTALTLLEDKHQLRGISAVRSSSELTDGAYTHVSTHTHTHLTSTSKAWAAAKANQSPLYILGAAVCSNHCRTCVICLSVGNGVQNRTVWNQQHHSFWSHVSSRQGTGSITFSKTPKSHLDQE